ncbi:MULTISPECIES: FAD-dependent oxidoreductase [unclassified Psychrobacter]|uniref:FAD-dependent oxidoreductase n=1 Tax=unclassified Psychrobacter TaxID=196806 RepID=UPI0025B52172|nr:MULTISPECIES: FAD-dependent oxidoreductase [unclassified Psychrobacter]MDN3451986.1 FAD-dependent oxidoreductase [Psychrobacter sp. APC 3350]MDN3501736.1 FAD-dependent oxidoreductase [Psychrobacter sp. 5A.1]
MTQPFDKNHAQSLNRDAHSEALSYEAQNNLPTKRVGILGGGTAGATIAIRLAALGLETYLFEKKKSLIDGPPMCHLHAGGNLYREIPDEDCVALLKQCIDILRLYPHTIDVRPTVFAVPTRDEGLPEDLLPRLDILTNAYQEMIEQDANNKVLGEPADYYQLYSHDQLIELSEREQVAVPSTVDEWMIPVAKYLDLNKVKFPLIVVQEYGWNIFRLAASATLALEEYDHAHVFTNTAVQKVVPVDCENCTNADHHVTKWRIDYQPENTSQPESIEVDYLVNACGFRTGVIDDMVGVEVTRMVEFKSSYVTHWGEAGGQIPEIIIYGQRGTPEGMAQLTPYPGGYFQIHGMSKAITLFDDGLVASSTDSAQPKLPQQYVHYIEDGWDKAPLQARSQQAIEYVAEFVPTFNSARTVGNALYGGQQIPGQDDTLRVADVSLYSNIRYARAENVKASSTLIAADQIVNELTELGLINNDTPMNRSRYAHEWSYLVHNDSVAVDKVARVLAEQRGFPIAMADVNRSICDAALNDLSSADA